MSDATNCTASRTYTERELVLAQRDAYARGLGEGTQYWGDDAVAKARHEYPLPKVTRPRVVDDPHVFSQFKADGGKLYWRGGNTGWYAFDNVANPPAFLPTEERVRLWADLLANPTEEVESE